ncbi:hypothetical protein D3C87_904150 [compost metagenome]
MENFNKLIPEYKSKIQNKEDNENYYNSIEYIDNELQNLLVRNYNHCDDYTYEIIQLADYMNEKFYKGQEKINYYLPAYNNKFVQKWLTVVYVNHQLFT